MILVWEGLEPEDASAAFGRMLENPESDHERYITSYVIPNLHGIDSTAGPPAPVEKVSTVDVSG